jgi:hypothetical protein
LNRSASLLASTKTCWARGVKSFIIAFPKPGAAYSFLKVDTTPALQHLPSKVKKIEYGDE